MILIRTKTYIHQVSLFKFNDFEDRGRYLYINWQPLKCFRNHLIVYGNKFPFVNGDFHKQSILIKIEQMEHLKYVEYIAILVLVLKSPLQISSRRQN